MTTHDIHRSVDENLYHSFKPNLVNQPSAFRSMSSSSYGSMLPTGTSRRQHSSHHGRPSPDVMSINSCTSPEAEAIDRWFENLQRYEQMLEEVAAASLDQTFKDELQHINHWFRCRSDAERTAVFYTLVQNASQIQIRFLITVLQQLANQDPLGALLSPAGQDKDAHPNPLSFAVPAVAGSVVSTESEYEMRKRQMYPPGRRTARTPFSTRLTSALSEPDDLRRNSRGLLQGSSLYQQGMLLEKALAARAQIQAANQSSSSRVSSASSSSSSTLNSAGFSPRLKASSTGDGSASLFGSDWPFSIVRNESSSPKASPISQSPATSPEDNWSFGSLSSRKGQGGLWGRKSTIKEDQIAEQEGRSTPIAKTADTTAAALNMLALEQAQARLRAEYPTMPSSIRTDEDRWSSAKSPPLPRTSVSTQPTIVTPTVTFSTPSQPVSPLDGEGVDGFLAEPTLTGAARRRKRSSAARALKDKIAAETVDFEVMKDVQAWLRTLRLHKYGHAFEGLQWQQVIRMTDDDMDQAGVKTIGARHKLLKVFENVQRHCEENDIEY